MILIIILFTLLLKSVEDALFDIKKKRASKTVEELWFVGLVLYLYYHNRQTRSEPFDFLICYYFIRAAIFDTLYNIVAKLPFLYIGSTSKWDDFMKRLSTWQYIIMKIFFLACGIIVYVLKLR